MKMHTNISNDEQDTDGESHGKEKEERKKVKTNFDRNWLRKNLRDFSYGFIVIFLFLIVYMVGQMTTYDMIKYVDTVCPGAQVLSASPLNGISIMPPGGYNVSKKHPELGYDMNFSGTLNLSG